MVVPVGNVFKHILEPYQLVAHLHQRLVKSLPLPRELKQVPHFGEESVLQKHWAGARNKVMKGALTLFAQDAASKLIGEAEAEATVVREEASAEADEIRRTALAAAQPEVDAILATAEKEAAGIRESALAEARAEAAKITGDAGAGGGAPQGHERGLRLAFAVCYSMEESIT